MYAVADEFVSEKDEQQIIYAIDAPNRAEGDLMRSIMALCDKKLIQWLILNKHRGKIFYKYEKPEIYAEIRYDGHHWWFTTRALESDGELLNEQQDNIAHMTTDELVAIVYALRRCYQSYRAPRRFSITNHLAEKI